MQAFGLEMPKMRPKNRAWNKGKVMGQRLLFTPSEVLVILYAIEQEQNARGLTMFNTPIDAMHRASDCWSSKWKT